MAFSTRIFMQTTFSQREQIIETVNKLFVYTDNQQWDHLLMEVFTTNVHFDMQSAGGGEPKTLAASDICNMWSAGFQGLDAIHHQAGNYIVHLNEDTANVQAYAIAIHYKNSATQGKTREFVGSYDLHLTKTTDGWRIDSFKYNLKFVEGNLDLM